MPNGLTFSGLTGPIEACCHPECLKQRLAQLAGSQAFAASDTSEAATCACKASAIASWLSQQACRQQAGVGLLLSLDSSTEQRMQCSAVLRWLFQLAPIGSNFDKEALATVSCQSRPVGSIQFHTAIGTHCQLILRSDGWWEAKEVMQNLRSSRHLLQGASEIIKATKTNIANICQGNAEM